LVAKRTEQRFILKSPARKFILAVLLCACVAFSMSGGVPEAKRSPQKQILFVCTGNHYRSRFAEALFNQKARQAELDWRAVSRGLRLVPSQQGISPIAQRELTLRGVPLELYQGAPKALAKEDLEQSDYIVLMDETEHRPLLEKQFPAQDDRKVHYWHIGESGKMKPAKACQAMSSQIEELLRTLPR
jgi:protein-tyrosine phosphatase